MTSEDKNASGYLLNETYRLIRAALGAAVDTITLERVTVGLFFTGVKLNNGSGGICSTPVKMIPEAVCCPSSAHAMPDSGRMRGKGIAHFMEGRFSGNPLQRTLAIAMLNALSETCRRANLFGPHEYLVGADPLDDETIPPDSYTVVIGALLPYLKMLRTQQRRYGILELDPRTLKEEEKPHYIQPADTPGAIAQADTLLVTGTTLINDTLEGILSHRKAGAKVILVGPTASLFPDALFANGIHSLGGITVTDADGLLDIIAEAGSGYHFYGKYAEKTVIRRPRPPA